MTAAPMISGTGGEATADPLEDTPYEGSPPGWWTAYGGALDVRSGVVSLPQLAELPPCPFPCARCRVREKR
jgi:hypothetical protein